MAFHDIGNFWLEPGESWRIGLARGNLTTEPEWGGQDLGAQWIMADPKYGGAVEFIVRDHSKERKPMHSPGAAVTIVYSVTVFNAGSRRASFSLQGGGNV